MKKTHNEYCFCKMCLLHIFYLTNADKGMSLSSLIPGCVHIDRSVAG